ncbi:dienelactone hydrolase [Oricola sp.]|uniref:alpha/beta hydrolase family protein n=1 Tax=Oricola sp. TaxID=1979950 RepID=UPI0025CFF0B4|nr:dienelactone hydrolase [Oricola sp.]MCI5074385.1 dienelactone hydrolase [Oricola sp.]
MNNLIDLARHIPTPEPALTVAYTPVVLAMEGRQPLELRVTAPAAGTDIPVVVFSHGHGPSNYIPSKDGYAHLAQFWAERGIAVIQPTHASSRVGGLPADAEGAPFFWRERVAEMKAVLDRLDEIEGQAPALAGRLDHARVAAAGHSFGGYTVGLLLGANLHGEDFRDPRLAAGMMLTAPGRGGSDLTPESAERFPFFDVDFSTLVTRTLVVGGDADDPHFTPRGPEWHADAFEDGPGAEAFLSMRGVGHGLGGIASLDARETETEAPDVLEATKRLTLAWLRTALGVEPDAWTTASGALAGPASALARVTTRKGVGS